MSVNERRAVSAYLINHPVHHCPSRIAAGALRWRIHGHYFA